MADLTQNPAAVTIGSLTTPTLPVTYGEAVDQGDAVYRNTDGRWYRCDANDGAAKAAAGGIALLPGTAAGAPGLIARPGQTPGQSLVNLGGTLVVGQVYCISTNLGGIRPVTDAGAGEYLTTLGQAATASLLDFVVSVATVPRAA